MLTKNDLNQIGGIVRTAVSEEIQKQTPKIVQPIVQNEINKAFKPLVKIAKDLHYIIRDFDNRITTNSREIDKVKQAIGYAQ